MVLRKDFTPMLDLILIDKEELDNRMGSGKIPYSANAEFIRMVNDYSFRGRHLLLDGRLEDNRKFAFVCRKLDIPVTRYINPIVQYSVNDFKNMIAQADICNEGIGKVCELNLGTKDAHNPSKINRLKVNIPNTALLRIATYYLGLVNLNQSIEISILAQENCIGTDYIRLWPQGGEVAQPCFVKNLVIEEFNAPSNPISQFEGVDTWVSDICAELDSKKNGYKQLKNKIKAYENKASLLGLPMVRLVATDKDIVLNEDSIPEGYRGRVGEIQFPNIITRIESFAFSNCTVQTGDTALKIPKSLKTIGAQAFSGADIEALSIPADVESVLSRAFSDMPNIKLIEFAPDSKLKYLSKNAFLTYCKRAQNLRIRIPRTCPFIQKIEKGAEIERYGSLEAYLVMGYTGGIKGSRDGGVYMIEVY